MEQGSKGTARAQLYDIICFIMFVSWLEAHILYLIRSQVGRAGGGAIFNTLKLLFFSYKTTVIKNTEAQIAQKLSTF